MLGGEVGEGGRTEGKGLGSGKEFDSLKYFSFVAFWLGMEPMPGWCPGPVCEKRGAGAPFRAETRG